MDRNRSEGAGPSWFGWDGWMDGWMDGIWDQQDGGKWEQRHVNTKKKRAMD